MSHIDAFIFYSWDSDSHKARVLKLASDLRRHGVDVVLDQWDLRLGDDLGGVHHSAEGGFLDRNPRGRSIPCLNENWASNGSFCQ